MNTIKKIFSIKRLLRASGLVIALAGILLVAGGVYADIPTRTPVRGTVPNPGTQQQELPNITAPVPYNVLEFTVTCLACHGGSIDQNAGHGGNWAGTSMASSARDPVFRANQIIVNNAIRAATGENGAGNLCMRCHSPNGWLSGRFDPSLAGDPEGRTMIQSILLSTDGDGIQCEFCHRALGNVTFKRPDLNPDDPVWNMLGGISDWPHSGMPYVDQVGDPTIAEGMPYGDATLQLHDGMTYNSRYPGTVDVLIGDVPLALVAGEFVPDPLGILDPLGTYTGQSYGIYPPGWTDPLGNLVEGQPAVGPDGSILLAFDNPIGPPPEGPNGQSMSLEHPTTDNGFVTGDMTSHESRLCGSCHDLTVPVLNQGMPEQRTYSEWKFSAFGTPGAEFRNCQDCHMPRLQHEYTDDNPVTLNVDPLLSGWFPYAKSRVNTAFHKLVGANRDLPMMMKELYPEVDLEVIGAATGNDTRIFPGMLSDRSTMWNRAQRNTEISLVDGVDVEIFSGPTWNGATGKWELQVKVTNTSGHRIPSGYPDGRRFWIEVEVTDGSGAVVYQSGSYDDATATLSTAPGITFNRALGTTIDEASNAVMVYERVTGACNYDPITGDPTDCSPSMSLLNDTILFDNRIPPLGFDYAAYRNAGIKFWNYAPLTFVPFEEATRYPPGQNWDLVTYTFDAPALPPATLNARVELYWQTHTRQFMEHLRDQDTSTVRPEGPPSIFALGYPLTPNYLSDQIGLATINDPFNLDRRGRSIPLRDNWGGIAYASWLITGKGAPYLVGADGTSAVGPPAAPANLIGFPLDPFTIQLTWDPVAGADGYLVWVKYGLGETTASWDKLGIVYDDGDLATPLLIQQEALNVAKSYQYKVEAFNGAGSSAGSGTITVTTPIDLPLPPENLTAYRSRPRAISLSWLDVADNEDGFVIQRQDVPVLADFYDIATMLSQTPGWSTGGNNLIDDGSAQAGVTWAAGYTPPRSGSTYNYRVAAYNAAGMSPWSLPVQAVTAGPPGSPTNLVAALGAGTSVDLTWSSATGLVEGYRVERRVGAGPFSALVTLGPAVLSYNDIDVLSGSTYTYRVFAFNAASGDSLPSNVATISIPVTAPADPTNLVATVIWDRFAPNGVKVSLTWSDNATDETGYFVERMDATNLWTVIATTGVFAGTGAYVDELVSPNSTYHYRVQAFISFVPAPVTSNYSNVETAVIPNQIPEAPSLLSVVGRTRTSLTLGWTDNSTNEDRFEIQRAPNVGGAPGPWGPSVLLAVNAISYEDVGLTRNTTYWYRVRACNVIGCSAWNGPVSGTTRR